MTVATDAPTLYRELPVPLAETSTAPGPGPASAAETPARRRVRLGPWELEGRVSLSSLGGIGPGVALGHRLAIGLVALADASLSFVVADAGKAGPSRVESSWGWSAGLELKVYLEPARTRRVVPLFRFRAAFAYSDVNVEDEGSLVSYRVSGTPYLGAAIFLTSRAGLLVELGAEVARVISSYRYGWEGAVVSRLAVLLRW